MHYSQIIYKGFIIRKDGEYRCNLFQATRIGYDGPEDKGGFQWASTFEDLLGCIDDHMDGREPEGYFQKY